MPGYGTIPTSKRLAIGLAYAVLVAALALTLPIGLKMHTSASS